MIPMILKGIANRLRPRRKSQWRNPKENEVDNDMMQKLKKAFDEMKFKRPPKEL